MNYRRDFEQSPLDGAPTMAAPAAGQQPGAWPQQAPPGGPGAPYGQPAPRVAPVKPSAVNPAPVSPNSPVPEPNPNPNPEQKQNPQPPPKEDLGDPKDPETGADTRGKVDNPPDVHNPGDPENPTPDELLCHPNPPGCTGDQKAPEKVEPPQQQKQPAP